MGVAPEPSIVSHITAVVMETGGGMNLVLADIPECVWCVSYVCYSQHWCEF